MRILAVGSYDSFIRTVQTIGDAFADKGADVELCVLNVRTKQISDRQIEAIDTPFRIVQHTMDSLCRQEVLGAYDVFVMSLDGASFRRFFYRLQDGKGARPLIVAVYPGLVLRYAFDGLSSRAAADLLWLNSKKDLIAYQSMCSSFGVDGQNARDFGLVPLLQAPYVEDPRAPRQKAMVFFEQAVIPRSLEDRRYLIEQLIALAEKYPDHELLLKPRTKPEDFTLHRTRAHFEALLKERQKQGYVLPGNLKVTYEGPKKLLSECAVCLTISSTVAIEALYMGIPTVIVGDFGSHDDSGLPFFFGSDIIRTFSDIDPDDVPDVNVEWLLHVATDPRKLLDDHAAEVFRAAEARKAEIEDRKQLFPLVSSQARFNWLRRYHTIDSIGYRAYELSRNKAARIIVNLFLVAKQQFFRLKTQLLG
nr:DUF6716 putative glycosyltransferase [uncultured Cohaesibacter sp.]